MLLLLGASLRGEKEQNISSQQTSNKIDQSPTFRQIFSKNYSLQNMVISRFSNPPPISVVGFGHVASFWRPSRHQWAPASASSQKKEILFAQNVKDIWWKWWWAHCGYRRY